MKNFHSNSLFVVALHFVAIACAAISYVDFKIVAFSVAVPMFEVMIVYYARIFRKIFSLWMVFVLGLIADSMSGGVLGATALSYIVVIKAFEYLEDRLAIKDSFSQVFRRFIMFLVSFVLLKYVVLLVAMAAGYDVKFVLIKIILTAICYVFVHNILEHYYKKYTFT